MRYGVTARRKRNMRRVGELAELRRERREARRAVGLANMVAQEAKAVRRAGRSRPRGSARPMTGSRSCRDFSLRIMRGDRIGVIGANGSGKTTLINLLTGALAPDSGDGALGTNVAHGEARPDARVAAADDDAGRRADRRRQRHVTINGERRHVIGYMGDFLFPPEQARTPIGKLSGGERGRLMLARALAAPSNLLVLDEPTNDLDIETLDLLQELLGEYRGHDPARQPRPRFSRPRRDLGDRRARATGAGPNMPAAIPTWSRSAATASPARPRRAAADSAREARHVRGADRSPAQAQAEVQRKARARGASRAHRDAAGRARGARTQARRLRLRRPRAGRVSGGDDATARSARASRRPRTSGWRSKSCARIWKAEVRIPRQQGKVLGVGAFGRPNAALDQKRG